jgi:hypothetical protein
VRRIREATPVLLTPAAILTRFHTKSPSVTAIRQALKDGVTDLATIPNQKSEFDTCCLVLLPPFIAKALIALPTLSCKTVFETVMSTITIFDRDLKSAAATDTNPEPSTNSTPSPGEFAEDPIDNPDKEKDFVEVPGGKPKATKSPKMSSTPKGSASAKKRAPTPSTFTNCSTLIRYCFLAQHQELHFYNLSDALIDGVAICPSHELIHKEWAALRHLQAGIHSSRTTETKGDTTLLCM